MKNSQSLLILVFTILINESCKRDEEDIKRPYTIVFCDFTSSVDSTESMKKIKSDAVSILKSEGTTNNIEFYVINKNNNSNCLFRNIPLQSSKPSAKRVFAKSLTRQADSLVRLLNSASLKASKMYPNEPNTCIVQCIERSLKYFKSYEPHPATPLRLYILSDMLECCMFSRKQVVCIEPDNDIESKLDLIPQITDSTLSFKEFQNIEVHIIISTNKVLEGNKEAFEKFWIRVFQRFGYDIRNKILVELPADIGKLPE